MDELKWKWIMHLKTINIVTTLVYSSSLWYNIVINHLKIYMCIKFIKIFLSCINQIEIGYKCHVKIYKV